MPMSSSMKMLVASIVVVVVVFSAWYAYSQMQPGTNINPPTPTATPSATPTQPPRSVEPPSPTPSNTITPSPTPNQGTPTPTLAPGTTPTPTPIPTPTPTPTPSPTPTSTVPSGTVVLFNFDNDLSNIYIRQPTPVTQTSSMLVAQFTSATSPASAFSVQSQATTSFMLSRTSGFYLEHTYAARNALDISFSQPIKSITLTFATIDYHDPAAGNPTPMQLVAYSNQAKTTTVGNPVTVSGSFITGDSYPQGTLTFSSNTPFSLVEIQTVYLAQGAVDFIVDNVSVTVA